MGCVVFREGLERCLGFVGERDGVARIGQGIGCGTWAISQRMGRMYEQDDQRDS